MLAAQALFALVVALVVGRLAAPFAPRVDLAIFWAAQHTATPYDAARIPRILGPGFYLFGYPPTFLILTWPLRWVPYLAAYVAWMATSMVALVVCVRRAAAPVLLAAPAVFLSALDGQTSLFVGTGLFLAARWLERRPLAAGVLLGLVASVKPQVGVFIPLLLIAGRHWRPVASAALTASMLSAFATGVFGPGIWLQWVASLKPFLAVADAHFAHRYLAVPGLWKLPVGIALASIIWRCGVRGQTIAGMTAATAAGLLISLHALDYDAAILAPFGLELALSSALPAAALAAAALAAFPAMASVAALAVAAGLCSFSAEIPAWFAAVAALPRRRQSSRP
jgi:hypothetical protein